LFFGIGLRKHEGLLKGSLRGLVTATNFYAQTEPFPEIL
jgi:hypothetical protein